MIEAFNSFVDGANGIIWNVLVYLLVGVGLFFTIATKGLQFRYFGHLWKLLKISHQGGKEGGISSFEALMTSLAARVGTGNLAGVAIAIASGGPGAVFWMWMTALVGMNTSFIESTLAQAYKEPHKDNVYRGGPAYYIAKGLHQKWLAVLFSICLLIAFGLAFNGVQSNTIALAFNESFGVPTWAVGIGLVLITAPIIFGGMKVVARAASLIVPFMAILYVMLALYVILTNLTLFPAALATIFKSAFGLEQVAGGAAGWAVKEAMMNGVRRGLFSNEAGMGSAPNAAATAKSYPDHPAVQGFMQMLGVFIDTLVICTATAVIVILSGVIEHGTEAKGIQLMQMAMSHHVGGWGGLFVAIAIFFFAFTSIIANYSYGESNIEFIAGERNSKLGILALRIGLLAMVMIGAVADLPAIWNFADLSMGLMAMINLIAIVWLSPVAFRIIKDYERQVKSGKPWSEIKFDPDLFPKLKHEANRDAWRD